MRSSGCKPSLGAWSRGLIVRSDAVAQVLLQRRNVRSDDGQMVPVRCIVAKRSICRGEQLCVIPESHILDGRNAATVLQRAAAQGCLPCYADVQQRIAAVRGDPRLLSTRDPLLIVLALYVLRHGGVQCPLADWAACLPPRIPPMGLLLQQADPAGLAPFKPLQRRLRIGDHTLVLPPGSGGARVPAAASSTELLLQAAEEYGVDDAGMPKTEVVASEALMTAFHRGVRHPLTRRQHEAANAQHRHAGSVAMRQLLQLEKRLAIEVLAPLIACVSPSQCGAINNVNDAEDNGDYDDNVVTASVQERLQWSHFMVRSRAINVQPRYLDAPRVAVVPFLDMLNHTARNPNVVYQHRPGVGVIVAAAQSIAVGEELTLNYGNYKQRGCLFLNVAHHGVVATTDVHAAAMRRIESRQMREWDKVADGIDSDDDDDNDDCIEEAPFGHGLQQQPPLEEEGKERGKQEYGGRDDESMEARTEGVWLWRFGFLRSDDEKAYAASRLWSKSLRQRIAQLTDVRRRGRKGEFVIGVPEGLQHLREERERLERERFGGTVVFPPQNT